MKFIISIMILSSLPTLARTKTEEAFSLRETLPGIQVVQKEEKSKSWIHQFETFPLGQEMDHMERMKNQRPNQFASK